MFLLSTVLHLCGPDLHWYKLTSMHCGIYLKCDTHLIKTKSQSTHWNLYLRYRMTPVYGKSPSKITHSLISSLLKTFSWSPCLFSFFISPKDVLDSGNATTKPEIHHSLRWAVWCRRAFHEGIHISSSLPGIQETSFYTCYIFPVFGLPLLYSLWCQEKDF